MRSGKKFQQTSWVYLRPGFFCDDDDDAWHFCAAVVAVVSGVELVVVAESADVESEAAGSAEEFQVAESLDRALVER